MQTIGFIKVLFLTSIYKTVWAHVGTDMFQVTEVVFYYNPFASYAHPPIVRESANEHEIGSYILVVDDRYPGISLSCGFDIAASARKVTLFYTLKTSFKV